MGLFSKYNCCPIYKWLPQAKLLQMYWWMNLNVLITSTPCCYNTYTFLYKIKAHVGKIYQTWEKAERNGNKTHTNTKLHVKYFVNKNWFWENEQKKNLNVKYGFFSGSKIRRTFVPVSWWGGPGTISRYM